MRDAYPTAHLIREIGRGAKGARSLTEAQARDLFGAMLAGRVSDLELGAILMALRIKGESSEELAGFLAAAEASFAPLPLPPGPCAPVLIPSYNGARKQPNLTPLLAMLLAREGVPVLVHGVPADPGRVTSAEIFSELGIEPSAAPRFAPGVPCLMTIDALAPRLARLLSLRRVLGVRNSAHTLVKLLQPFDGPALRLSSYTHPAYLALLRALFTTRLPAARGAAFLTRGTEGEPVASARRGQQIACFYDGVETVLAEKEELDDGEPALPADLGAQATAAWIAAVLAGEAPAPPAIVQQVRLCAAMARRLAA